MGWTIIVFSNFILSIIAGLITHKVIVAYIPIFLNRQLVGYDQCKANKTPVPEPFGVVVAAVYLIFIFIFIPILFSEWIGDQSQMYSSHMNLISLLAGLVTICTAILLGFADDILDLQWRHKLIFPTLSSMPLLIVYFLSGKSTAMHLPHFVQNLFGSTYVDLGFVYYIFIVMLVIFCTNAINIIAGINGVEVGQSLVIALSIALYSAIQIYNLGALYLWNNILSLCFILPFITTSFSLLMFNMYPARVFVGDTYCYWAGMTLAVCAITGHFSKTLLLFLVPQILNFVYSCPQLFKLIPCPRHRLPKFDAESGLLHMSLTEIQLNKLSPVGALCVKVLRYLKLIYYTEYEKDGESYVQINNLTILNFILKLMGPQKESDLTKNFLLFQSFCSIVALIVRFCIPVLIYN